jgi:hypothetical protein
MAWVVRKVGRDEWVQYRDYGFGPCPTWVRSVREATKFTSRPKPDFRSLFPGFYRTAVYIEKIEDEHDDSAG